MRSIRTRRLSSRAGPGRGDERRARRAWPLRASRFSPWTACSRSTPISGCAAATVTLAGELDEDSGEKQGDSVRATVADENSEILTSGIRLSVFERGRVLAGEKGSSRRRTPARRRERARSGGEPALFRTGAGAWSQPSAWTNAGCTGCTRSRRWAPWCSAQEQAHLEHPALALGGAAARSPVALALDVATRSVIGARCWQRRATTRRWKRFAGPCATWRRACRRCSNRRIASLRTRLTRSASPPTALRAELELLAEESESTEREAPHASLCASGAALGLVDRLLFLALPTEKLSEGFETLSVADLVEQIASELPETHRARLKLELSGEGLVRGDLALLRSAISERPGKCVQIRAGRARPRTPGGRARRRAPYRRCGPRRSAGAQIARFRSPLPRAAERGAGTWTRAGADRPHRLRTWWQRRVCRHDVGRRARDSLAAVGSSIVSGDRHVEPEVSKVFFRLGADCYS